FSRLSQGVTSDAGLLLGLTASDVAAGLAAAVDGDPTGRFRAPASGATLTIDGPAFNATWTAGRGTVTPDTTASVHAYIGPLTLTLSGTVNTGDVWKIRLDGVDIGYGVQLNDDLAKIAQQLANTIRQGGLFDATSNGTALTITPHSSNPYTATLTVTNPNPAITPGSGTATASSFTFSGTAWAKLVLDVSVTSTIEPRDAWILALNAGQTSASAVSYTYVAGE